MTNNKVGFNYYNVDTDRYQDIKIKRLKKDFGPSGLVVYDYILCEIYRVRGCFLEWDESTAFDVADYFGIKESLINEIVNYCCVVGLFDKGLLSSGRILTSLSIQRRYIEMSIRSKRKNVFIPKRVKIPEELTNIPEESVKPPEEWPKIPEVSPKVKESKVKKNNPPNPPNGGNGQLKKLDDDFFPEESDGNETDFIDRIVEAFKQVYDSHRDNRYLVISKGKERAAAGKILKEFKKINPECSAEETLNGLKDYFEKCVTIRDNWLYNNMSLSIIVNKFNEINTILTNGTTAKGRYQPLTSDQDIERIVAGHFAGQSTD